MSKFESKIQKDLVTDAVFTESSEEFILPDYMPEIGRVLRVTATLFPEDPYLGSDAAEFSGRVEYRLLYSSSEGRVTEAPLLGRYRYRLPVGEKQITAAYTSERVETLSARPSAPRKLGIRTRITAHPHLLYEDTVGVPLSSLVGDAPLEISEGCFTVLTRQPIPYGILHAEDAVTVEGTSPDNLTLLSSESAILTESAEAKDGYLSARGRITLTLLLQKEGEVPFVKTCVIPFEEDIPTEGCYAGDAVSLSASVAPPTVSMEEAGEDTALHVSAEYLLSGFLSRNTEVPVLRDFYVIGERHAINYRTLTLPAAVGCYTGNITAEGDAALPEDLATDGKCLVPHFTVKEQTVSPLAHRVGISGTLAVTLLALGEQGGEKADLTLPFRIELPLDGMQAEGDALWVSVAPVGGSAQRKGSVVHLATELAVTARAERPVNIEYPVSAVKLGDVTGAKESTVTVYYPTDGDTLWSVGKSYARPIAELKKQNGFPEEGEPEADDRSSLDGYAYLLIDSL